MKKNALLLFSALILLGGCRSGKDNELPEVKPLPGEEKVQITLNVNITDEGNPDRAKADKKAEKKESVARKTSHRNDTIILSPASRKKLEKKNAENKRKKHELVPSGVGLIDSELNGVEQSYLKQVRSRHEQQLRSSERQVFGSFAPDNIFKQPE